MQLKKIRKEDPKFSRATLYRNLVSFCKEGKLDKLNFFDGADRFEIASEPHYHVVCQKCGKVENVREKQLDMPKNVLDYEIKSHNITYFGICPKCREK